MRFKFFTVPVFDSEEKERALNTFLSSHVITKVDREVMQSPMGEVWAICVGYLDPGEASKAASSSNKNRIDYREVLSEPEFVVFARLRNLRKDLAEAQGVPAYTLFTNEQLAAMVRSRTTTKAALAEVKGVGSARVDKYGEAFLQLIADALGELQDAPA